MVCRGNDQLTSNHGRSRKIWDLLIYLVTHRHKPLAPETIAETLWPDQDYENPARAVKNLVYRLRLKIENRADSTSPPAVINAHGCYLWNEEYPCFIDAEEFEKTCRRAQARAKTDPAGSCAIYRDALSLYRGEYLPENPYSEWLLPVRQHYRRLFAGSVSELLEILKKQKNYAQMLEECEKALNVEHFEEDLHIRYMEALLGEGKTARARAHYEYISALLYREFSALPSPALRGLYRAIQEQDKKADLHYQDIREVLQERDEAPGALLCEPAIFRLVCRMERRRAERDHRPVHLGLLSFNGQQFNPPPRALGRSDGKPEKHFNSKPAQR